MKSIQITTFTALIVAVLLGIGIGACQHWAHHPGGQLSVAVHAYAPTTGNRLQIHIAADAVAIRCGVGAPYRAHHYSSWRGAAHCLRGVFIHYCYTLSDTSQ